jgi:hypothetical protein
MADTTIRFASWGRVSTEDRQDPESSRAWQYARGKALIEPHGGVIVAEFFDIDKSRSIPPQRRPEAKRSTTSMRSRCVYRPNCPRSPHRSAASFLRYWSS